MQNLEEYEYILMNMNIFIHVLNKFIKCLIVGSIEDMALSSKSFQRSWSQVRQVPSLGMHKTAFDGQGEKTSFWPKCGIREK
jgi:hypothetical protein